jgi:hypothetical protein
MDNLFWGTPYQDELKDPYMDCGGFVDWLSQDLCPCGIILIPQKEDVRDRTPVEYTREVYEEQLMEMIMEHGEFLDEDPSDAKIDAQCAWDRSQVEQGRASVYRSGRVLSSV